MRAYATKRFECTKLLKSCCIGLCQVRETEEALKRGQQVTEAHAGQPFEDDMKMVIAALASMSWPATDDPPGIGANHT